MSFIYAANSADERMELWRDIQCQHDQPLLLGTPSMLMGDFNEILDLEEHSNFSNTAMVTSGMRDFQDMMRYCSFREMKTHGPKYT